jgi:hypothetical protein
MDFLSVKTTVGIIMDAKIIYIAGGGHSGSTLLDMIISSSNDVVSLGEVYFYDSYRYDTPDEKLYAVHAKDCSCGEPFDTCPFWSAFHQQLNRDISIKRQTSLGNSLKVLWNIFKPFKNRFWLRLEVDDDVAFFNTIEKTIQQNDGNVSYLIDSSKDPRRLLRLVQQFGKEKIIVFHLVRDGRGYVNSYCNKDKKRVVALKLQTQNFIKTAFIWAVVNISTRLFVKRNELNSVHISYDLFCNNPLDYIHFINKKYNIRIPDDFLHRVNNKVYHNIHGNSVRYSHIKKIKQDRSWHSELPPLHLRILNILLSPLIKHFVAKDDVSNQE